MWLLLAWSCSTSLVPAVVAGPLGQSLCEAGHPRATCGQGRVVAQSGGPLAWRTRKDRWVDLEIRYERKERPHTMTARIYVQNVAPCRVRVDVIADDGPNPVLLDNAVSGRIAGGAICKQLGAR